MLKNYFKSAVRNLIRFKLYSAISIVGLAVGIASCLFVFLYVQHEYSYDDFQKNADHTFLLYSKTVVNNTTDVSAYMAPGYGAYLERRYPELTTVRFAPFGGVFRYGRNGFSPLVAFVDSAFLKVFTFPMLKGNPATALSEPYSLVLTASTAKKIFGVKDPVGQTLEYISPINNTRAPFKVTGVVKDVPENSTVGFECLASFASVRGIFGPPGVSAYTYIMVPPDMSMSSVKADLRQFALQIENSGSTAFEWQLLPLRQVFFSRSIVGWSFPTIDRRSVVLSSMIALLILIIACVNDVNLSTARALTRKKEAGVRRVVGASREQIITQFLVESLTLTFVAMVLAGFLVEALLPAVNSHFHLLLSLSQAETPFFVGTSVALWLVVGLGTGIYPSLVLSRPEAGDVVQGTRKRAVDKALIMFQFTISIALIAITVVISRQYRFMSKMKPGFNPNNLLAVSIPTTLRGGYDSFADELTDNPNVIGVARSNTLPLFSSVTTPIGYADPSGSIKQLPTTYFIVDPEFVNVLELHLITGSDSLSPIVPNTAIITDVTAKSLGWTPAEAVGKVFSMPWGSSTIQGQIIGVVSDIFVYNSPGSLIPSIIFSNPMLPRSIYSNCLIRISGKHKGQTLQFIHDAWKSYFPGFTFAPRFMNEGWQSMARPTEDLATTIAISSLIALLISSIGIFGLVSYMAERRTKELGIRKVLGASTTRIISLLGRDFIVSVAWANAIAWPLAFYVTTRWLNEFARRIPFTIWPFALAAFAALALTAIAVSSRTLRAAKANPVEALRYE